MTILNEGNFKNIFTFQHLNRCKIWWKMDSTIAYAKIFNFETHLLFLNYIYTLKSFHHKSHLDCICNLLGKYAIYCRSHPAPIFDLKYLWVLTPKFVPNHQYKNWLKIFDFTFYILCDFNVVKLEICSSFCF